MGWLLAIIFGVATAWTASAGGPAGALLFGITAGVLALLSLHGTVVRPRLSANDQGIHLREVTGSRQLSWSEIRVQLRMTRRLARDVTTLEIEHNDEIFVYGWLDLGQDPQDVFDALEVFQTKN